MQLRKDLGTQDGGTDGSGQSLDVKTKGEVLKVSTGLPGQQRDKESGTESQTEKSGFGCRKSSTDVGMAMGSEGHLWDV